jgi:putative ABC transport system ATP-binding protein
MLLEAHRLTRRYGAGDAQVNALTETSFSVAEAEFVAVMGPSGSGKSTLMNLIGLLDRPTSGRLVLAGEDTTALDHDRLAGLRNRRIGFVFQAYNLLARNTTLENVEMPLVYSGLRGGKRRLRARAALEAVGLSHRVDHWPGELSGGEQQRVAIARARRRPGAGPCRRADRRPRQPHRLEHPCPVPGLEQGRPHHRDGDA